MKKDFVSSEHYLNRELSWLEFNQRVLGEASDPENPLLERLKFLGIVASNLDEFFMVRVAGLVRLVEAGVAAEGPDDRTPRQQLDAVLSRVRRLAHDMDAVFTEELRPALECEGIHLLTGDQAREAATKEARHIFEQQILPVITPMAIDQGHPFPVLLNHVIYQIAELEGMPGGQVAAPEVVIIQLPTTFSRFVRLDDREGTQRFVLLGDVMRHNLHLLYPEAKSLRSWRFRISRDSDLTVDEEGAEDLLKAIETELLMRKQRAPVRLECDAEISASARDLLLRNLELTRNHVFPVKTLMDMSVLMSFAEQVDRPDLKFAPRAPMRPFEHLQERDIFKIIREKDRILYHPYHSFEPVEELVMQAADDPRVLAIKQTLYRTSSESPIIAALEKASLQGKHVTVLVELKARFDEERNIEWARRLEQSGAHVIYGLVGLKTHSKALMVVRRDEDGIRRYLHLGTGNYNSKTARLYTDLAVLTCHRETGDEVAQAFNVITGYTRPGAWHIIDFSPITLRRKIHLLLRRETENARKGRPARIIAKMNSLVDTETIDVLYEASQAGVEIDLIVRGICCLRPGIPGFSDNIRVRSIVGRYLEHARIFYFLNAGDEEYYLSSADWMPRNFDRRVELMFPVLDADSREFIREALDLQLADNVKAHIMKPDGTYEKPPVPKKAKRINCQDVQYERTRADLMKRRERRREALVFQPATAPNPS